MDEPDMSSSLVHPKGAYYKNIERKMLLKSKHVILLVLCLCPQQSSAAGTGGHRNMVMLQQQCQRCKSSVSRCSHIPWLVGGSRRLEGRVQCCRCTRKSMHVSTVLHV
ncbi:hypothetical protein C8Q80DRAFT_73291 [Daedaleopsis nitida]|nr:hypothetical protein C8Q80DRAFT_73291 [Daedaleopsis nitida]